MTDSPSAVAFEAAYNQLNPRQRQAVDSLEGPVMVLAGPGTGKTQVLATRIARIVASTDTDPSSILALTFTDSAAQNMRRRLTKLMGPAGLYVNVHTFHSLCSEVIANYPEYFDLGINSQPVTEVDRFAALEEVLLSLPLTVLRPVNAPLLYLRAVVKAISDLKRENVTPDKLAELTEATKDWLAQSGEDLTKTDRTKQEKIVLKNQELVLIYQAYQEALKARGWYDFDDMIMLVAAAFREHAELLQVYQEKLLYFLVDEYQDTNSAQNDILDLLASFWGEEANVFVVGDPHQAIYRFQGASLENVVSFTARYPQAQVITLDQGYRCTQLTYDAAATLIGHNSLQVNEDEPANAQLSQILAPVRLTSQTKIPGGLQTIESASGPLECIQVAEQLKTWLAQGVPADQLAVLFRHNADAIDLATVLEQWQIPFEIDGGSDVFKVPVIESWVSFLRALHAIRTNDPSPQLYQAALAPWSGIDPVWVMRSTKAAAAKRQTLWEFWQAGSAHWLAQPAFSQLTPLELVPLETWLATLEELLVAEAQLPLDEWLIVAWQRTGLMNWVTTQPLQLESLHALHTVLKTVRALRQTHHRPAEGRRYGLAELLQTWQTYQEHGLTLLLEDFNVQTAAVKLSTVHKAKGQEWQQVILFRCLDGKWGNTSQRELLPLVPGIVQHAEVSSKERNEDERRLFYVALTRAKDQVIMTSPQTLTQQGKTREMVPSLFLTEIASHTQSVIPVEPVTPEAQIKTLEQLLQPKPETLTDLPQSYRVFFGEQVENFSLSVSALNDYLRSVPDFVARHLLRIPQPIEPALAYGSAVHLALEKLFKAYLNDQAWLSWPETERIFLNQLAEQALTPSQLAMQTQRGQEALKGYYEHVTSQTWQPLFIERFFGTGWSQTWLGDIRLKGKIDRIDWVDQEAKTVRVIDYKTGKTKTWGELKGETQSAGLSERELALPEGIRSPYQRQLLFYKLLTQLDKTFVPTVVEGQLEFVEPDKRNGDLVSRTFELPAEHVQALTELIKTVMTEIRGLKFLEQLPTHLLPRR